MNIRRLATLTGIALLTSACTSSRLVNDVSQLQPKESGFKANLHREYIKLAKAELEEGDYFDTGIFSRRAESAAMGKNFGPDRLWQRDFDKKNRALLNKELDRLVKALDGGGRAKQPVFAARAQTQFDCWAQELEENNQPRDIQRCRNGYMVAMRDLADAMKPAPRPKMAMKPKLKEKIKKIKTKSKALTFVKPYVVYFDFDSATLSGMNSVRTLTQAVAAVKNNKSARIEVIGHTDTAGSADYNLKLSEKRAKLINQALTALGINLLTIEQSAMGQKDLAIETKDGIREAANRRVVIVVY